MANTLIFLAEKMLSSFCIANATDIFAAKISMVLENILATSANMFVINKLIKLKCFKQLGPAVVVIFLFVFLFSLKDLLYKYSGSMIPYHYFCHKI